MTDLSTEDRIKLAVQFIAQSPPGEVNDVINDIRAIIADDKSLTPHVAVALREYNVAQLHAVEHASSGDLPDHVSLLSEATILPGSTEERYIDHDGKRSFAFDHQVSDFEPYALPESDEAFRSALSTSLHNYVKNHYTHGYCSVSTNQIPAPTVVASEPTKGAETGVGALSLDEPESAETPAVEQPGTGTLEEVATPTPEENGKPLTADDEVDVPGGVENLDEEMEEVKEEEEKEKERDEGVGHGEDAEVAENLGEEKADVEEEKEAVEVGTNAEEEQGRATTVEKSETETEPIEAASTSMEPTSAPAPALENPTFTLEIVGTRYNPNNYWTGRWRSRWVVNQSEGTVNGTIKVDVHYYEQGNVQLATEHNASFACPTEEVKSQSVASQIVTALAKVETNYQLEMNDVYASLGDEAFRQLRRALPVTRQKIDWDKVQGYALGADLSRARA